MFQYESFEQTTINVANIKNVKSSISINQRGQR